MIEELLLLVAVGGLIWKAQNMNPIRGPMCNTGMCETMTTRSVAPPEQQILLDTPVNTTGRDDTLPINDVSTSAFSKIRKSVVGANQTEANDNPGVALGSPAVL